jgi:hypothetical protein
LIGADDLIEMDIPQPDTIIDSRLPSSGACLIIGAQKSNKTLLALQLAIAAALDHPLFDWFPRIGERSPVIFFERDDPAGDSSVQAVLKRSPVVRTAREQGVPIPFYLVPRIDLTLGPGFTDWLRGEIMEKNARLVVLDSYTALRPPHLSGGDIVKIEYAELSQLDQLGKLTNCLIVVVHHASKSSAELDWTQQAGGSFGMTAATEAQIYISRFSDLPNDSPARLVRIRGRHIRDTEVVLSFRKETLDHELLIEGPAATLYPLISSIQFEFRDHDFSAKELEKAIGIGHTTSYRYLHRLLHADVLVKTGVGRYKLESKVKS